MKAGNRATMPATTIRAILALAAGLNLIPLAYTGLLLAPGTVAGGGTDARLHFIAGHAALWSIGWVLWMAGSLGLVLSIWVLARVMSARVPDMGNLLHFATVIAILGSASDLIGDAVQVAILPFLAEQYGNSHAGDVSAGTISLLFDLADRFATAISGGVANSLYAIAVLLTVIALARIGDFPRWITLLGAVACLATITATPVIFFPALVPAVVAGALIIYCGWLGAIAGWGLQAPIPSVPRLHLHRV